MKLKTVIRLLKNIKKGYWEPNHFDVNSYNKGFSEGVNRAINLLRIVEKDKK